MAKIIKGYYESGRVIVSENGVDNEIMPDAAFKSINKGTRRFYWGFDSDGAAHLALAMLLQFLPDKTARAWYYEFNPERNPPTPVWG
jgi:hypothetical protein